MDPVPDRLAGPLPPVNPCVLPVLPSRRPARAAAPMEALSPGVAPPIPALPAPRQLVTAAGAMQRGKAG